jgi:hypothetical protein
MDAREGSRLERRRGAARRLLVPCLLWCGLSAVVRGDLEDPGIGRPVARDVRVEVESGGVVEITLGASSTALGRHEFVVRRGPERGRLGPIQPVAGLARGGVGGVVIYRSEVVEARVEDQFTYTVRAAGGVSLPATVTVTLLPPRPRLTYDQLEGFGGVFVGREGRKVLRVCNGGLVRVEGGVVVPEGFVAVPERVSLAPQECIDLEIMFRPGRAAAYGGEAILAGEMGGWRIPLTGEGLVPVRVRMGAEGMSWDGERHVGKLIVGAAQGAGVIEVELEGVGGVGSVGTFVVGEGQEREVELVAAARAGDGAAGQGGPGVRVWAGGYEEVVRVELPEVAPRIELWEAGAEGGRVSGVEFGEVLVRGEAAKVFLVRNLGAGDVPVRAEISPPWSLRGLRVGQVIGMGDAVEIEIVARPVAVGRQVGELRLETVGGMEVVALGIEGILPEVEGGQVGVGAAEPGRPSRGDGAGMVAGGDEVVGEAGPRVDVITAARVSGREARVPGFRSVRPVYAEEGQVRFRWEREGGAPEAVMVERMVPSRGEEGVGLRWEEVGGRLSIDGSPPEFRLIGLGEGQSYTLRFSAVEGEKISRPSEEVMVLMPVSERRGAGWFWLVGGLALVGVAGGVCWWRYRGVLLEKLDAWRGL